MKKLFVEPTFERTELVSSERFTASSQCYRRAGLTDNGPGRTVGGKHYYGFNLKMGCGVSGRRQDADFDDVMSDSRIADGGCKAIVGDETYWVDFMSSSCGPKKYDFYSVKAYSL